MDAESTIAMALHIGSLTWLALVMGRCWWLVLTQSQSRPPVRFASSRRASMIVRTS